MKKIGRILLTTIMCFFICGMFVHANGTYQGSGYTLDYITEGDAAAITNCHVDDRNSYIEVMIPDRIDGYRVVSINYAAFYGCTNLTSVAILDTVIRIGHAAFDGCTNLTSITIPNSVTEIESDAFWGCASLTNVTIPNSVTTIKDSAFRYCASLTSITIPNGVTKIDTRTFQGCTSLKSVTIPGTLIRIEEGAFWGCTSLTSVTIPNSVTTINRDAFVDCTSLMSLTIPNSVTRIGAHAFGMYYSQIFDEFNPINGFTAYIYEGNTAAQSYCSANNVKYVVLPNHSWSSWKTTKKATALAKGEEIQNLFIL